MSVMISVVQLRLRFIIILIISLLSAGNNAQLHYLSNCICPGYVMTYECTVFGDGFTVWRGSAFDCPLSGNEILLSHNNFEDGTTRTCNDGAIIGRSMRIMDNYYTSQLAVSFTTRLDGRTIECMHIGGTASAMTIGSSVLLTTTDPLPPPSDVGLFNANPNSLTFKWSSVITDCSAIHYIIESDCGSCHNTTSLTSVDCSIMPITTSRSCEFAVKSVICGNIIGNSSNAVFVTLNVPDSPMITSITSTYSGITYKGLLNLNILFSEVDSFMISQGIDGSPLYYTVTYFDASQNNTICGSDIISSSSCLQGVCSSSLPLSCYQMSVPINFSIFASNRLGNGTTSSVSIGDIDQYVNINFESTSRVVCEFLNQRDKYNNKSCTITFGSCQQNVTQSVSVQGHTTSNTVRLELSSDLQSYCYIVNANNGSFVVLIEGIYSNNGIEESQSFALVISTTAYNIILIFCVSLVASFVLVLYYKQSRRIATNDMQFSICMKPRPNLETQSHPDNSQTDESDPIIMELRPELSRTEPITAHVIFEAADKPWTLMHILKSFKNINIIDIMISPLMMTRRTRKVYLQCESELPNEQREDIRNCSDSIMNIEFPTGQLIQSRGVYGDKPEPFIGYRYTRSLPTCSGSLYKLLKSIHNLSRKNKFYQWINITNITFRQPQAYPENTIVDIMFVCELPKNWRNEFDGEHNNPSYMQEVSTSV